MIGLRLFTRRRERSIAVHVSGAPFKSFASLLAPLRIACPGGAFVSADSHLSAPGARRVGTAHDALVIHSLLDRFAVALRDESWPG